MSRLQRPVRYEDGTTVAVVDARPTGYDVLTKTALRLHLHCEFFSSGTDAVHHAGKAGADLWVVHVALPDMSGFDLCGELKAILDKPVIYMVTDDYRAEDERAAWACGASMFGSKPVPEAWFADWHVSEPARRRARDIPA